MKNERNNSYFSDSCSELDENKIITEALITPYEKVMKILTNIKVHLEMEKADNLIINDLDWVIVSIQSHKLYTYDNHEGREEIIKMAKKSDEVKSFFDYLNNFSENREVRRRNKHISKTTFAKPRWSRISPLYNTGFIEFEDKRSSFVVQQKIVNDIKLQSITPPKIGNDSLSIDKQGEAFENVNGLLSTLRSKNSVDDINKNIKTLNFDLEEQETPGEKMSFDNTLIFHNLSQEIHKIFDVNFNIFEFQEIIGRSKVLTQGTKAIIENFELNKIICSEYLENFLCKVRDGYIQDNPYHNDLHGFDVCQAIAVFLTHSNIVELLYLTDHDILAFILSAVVHDLGHPGLTNNFQINSNSDIALVYNDKSVLESYHVSEAFRIMRDPECNILYKLDAYDYRRVRKRMIEAILSTDMVSHAKVQSLVKNRLMLNNIKQGVNQDKIVNKNSNTFFEDQQEILNFVIHSADISHNSRSFSISQKWTGLLMEEFWRQGDLEIRMNLPVSFLCDRATSEIPKSQIGFITGIIIPTFDALIDFLPTLNYFRENVYTNIEEWRKIVNQQESEKEKNIDK